MELVFEDDFLKITVSNDKSLTYFEWKDETEYMKVEQFVPLCEKIMNTVLDNSTTLLFENCKKLNFPVPPDVQELVATQMISQFSGKLTKLAHVYSEDLVSRLSQEQIWAENKEENNFEEKYFISLEDAQAWILE
ncbi:hypothetical protein [uncultured Microscilla sp.]|uniref:hypothetical protein n=1 Tax=uncultured Microscilla sp. TaxID=432653 RepID=UPI00262F8220|nr:hypothetical protein [uncultured Microscilla sp.]